MQPNTTPGLTHSVCCVLQPAVLVRRWAYKGPLHQLHYILSGAYTHASPADRQAACSSMAVTGFKAVWLTMHSTLACPHSLTALRKACTVFDSTSSATSFCKGRAQVQAVTRRHALASQHWLLPFDRLTIMPGVPPRICPLLAVPSSLLVWSAPAEGQKHSPSCLQEPHAATCHRTLTPDLRAA